MKGLDYRWLDALDAVIANGGFDKAAEALFITQSAVSQRIKQLETLVAQPVLIRETPPQPTAIGKKLLGLHRRVQLLEKEMLPELTPEGLAGPITVPIATNADSLATWLLPALSPLMKAQTLEINLIVDDESRTLNRLRSGEAVVAVSNEATPLKGCVAESLGVMEYLCVCTPAFKATYFPDGLNAEAVSRAPAVVFDRFDDMHTQFVSERFQLPTPGWRSHMVRSSEAFVKMAKLGVAYCLIPRLQIEPELTSGELIDLCPGDCVIRHLYWHHFATESGVLAEMSSACLNYARKTFGEGKISHTV
ncbi:chromosome replication initiation inhibitor protein [Grimontia sp. AD028]|uniref:LysR family transcriptional regulator ArgP n=1 Tax=Grimontia sp. AD028 TaxID=1581149 RepID=UPI00061ACD4A|nr:LysR family transcriptional regulator ArgP [Grimontia sp. AD028]KKD61110.1 chromosome replication initiation inhibitor protein [Grimontia sp. AD028]